MTSSDLEPDLLSQAAAGDRAALAQLLLLHYDSLQRHISRRLSPPLARLVHADDVLHQTLVRAAQAIGTYEFRHGGAFRGWLKTIADNLIKNLERRQHRERLATDQDAPGRCPPPNSSWKALIERVAGNATTPSTAGQRRENRRRVRAALATLPEHERDIVQRYYLDGQTLEQIAEALGSTKGAIRGICYRARRRLRDLMGRSSLYFSG